jgi:hypothetical protein
MDTPLRTRSCIRHRTRTATAHTSGGARQICIRMTRETYDRIWADAAEVRRVVEDQLRQAPELFPDGIEHGFQLTGRLPESRKMPGVRLRQLRLRDGRVFSLRPSFVMSYMMGDVEELEGALLLLSIGVPGWIIAKVCGHNEMKWYRMLTRLGRNSLVGATVHDPDQLPEHLVADEHHADWHGQKGYVAFTAGGGCILGTALTAAADEEHLTEAYGQFAQECRHIKPDYAPVTVNTDGWFATQNTFRALFASVQIVLCFLHGFLKIRDRCRKDRELHAEVWNVYRAETAPEFHERMKAFRTWFETGNRSLAVSEMVAKLWNRAADYAVSYAHPGCHRTSNMVDRLMNGLTRFLYHGRGLHGHQQTSELRLRGWSLLQNFRPFAPRGTRPREYHSPAHRLNQHAYDPHWLHNLQLSCSMMGYKRCT